MKKTILSASLGATVLLFSNLTTSLAFGQIDTTLRDYFPTHLGDLWEYEEDNPPFSFRYQVKITGDTLMENGKQYIKFTGLNGGFYRLDDSLRVYRYAPQLVACSDSEYLIYDLGIRDRAIWPTCLPLNGGGDSLSRFIGLYATFPQVFYWRLRVFADTKAYCDAQVHIPAGDTTFCNLAPRINYVPQHLAKGFGLVLTQLDGPGHVLDGAIINGVTYGTVTSVGNTCSPDRLSLDQNHPNPFNPSTTIEYSVPQRSFVTLKVYNLLGQEVATLVDGEMGPGQHSITWNADGKAGGVYFCRLATENKTTTIRLLLLR